MTFYRNITCLLMILCSIHLLGAQQRPIEISGIYPHLAVFNENHQSEHPKETGIGAVVSWAGKLWAISYPAHKPFGSSDKLYSIDADLTITIHPESVGGTHANRMIHRESNQLIIGPYFIDSRGNVRAIDPKRMPGRLTATARHLTDPQNKVYFYTMEEGLYEVDVHTLEVKELFKDGNNRHPPDIAGTLLPGYHGKGAYTSQKRLVVANNGEFDWQNKSSTGCLAQWDGTRWQVIETKQFTDVTGPGDIEGNKNPSDPVWTIGWDKKSLILKLLEDDNWYTYRLPKASFSYDGKHGWHTEWPRIRKIDTRWLMTMHGMFWEFPGTLCLENTAGLKPIATYLKIISDFCDWNGRLVFGCDDASVFDNRLVGQPQSNFWFTSHDTLTRLGPKTAYGNVYAGETLPEKSVSEPFLVSGFENINLHLAHSSDYSVSFVIEIDRLGSGQWQILDTVLVPARSYRYTIYGLLDGTWLRVRNRKACDKVSAAFHCSSDGYFWNHYGSNTFKALSNIGDTTQTNFGLLSVADKNRNLQYQVLTGRQVFFEIDETLNYFRSKDQVSNDWLQQAQKIERRDFIQDQASVIVIDDQGERLRLPRGNDNYKDPVSGYWPRSTREVVTERSLFNCNGTFYELPRPVSGGFKKMKPITTHNKMIMDFCSWRGMMVLSGANLENQGDGHYYKSSDNRAGLWFGTIDDLWKFGKPVGEGGPWYQAEVKADEISDPYLMTGFDKKTLILESSSDLVVTVEVDFDFNGWHKLMDVRLTAEKPFTYLFEKGFSVHWIRFKVDRAGTVSAHLVYD